MAAEMSTPLHSPSLSNQLALGVGVHLPHPSDFRASGQYPESQIVQRFFHLFHLHPTKSTTFNQKYNFTDIRVSPPLKYDAQYILQLQYPVSYNGRRNVYSITKYNVEKVPSSLLSTFLPNLDTDSILNN